MRRKRDVAEEVASLSNLSHAELTNRWRDIYHVSPPKGVRHELMVRAVAWHLQAKRLGGLSAETRRLLRSAVNRVEGDMLARTKLPEFSINQQGKGEDANIGTANQRDQTIGASAPRQRRRITPGARLMREWNGRMHVIDVVEGGYAFEEKIYPSLTAIAGKITGTHWSGPRFFGL